MFGDGMKSLVRIVLLALLSSVLTGCYYARAVGGQVSLLAERRPIAAVRADPATPADVAHRLALVERAREFAVAALALPDSGSFTSYAELRRPYPVWLVVATPEFSFVPQRWCFVFAGCFSYRGYYDESVAQRYAHSLAERGLDVAVFGVPAYSTLGWFDDPVLSSMLRGDDVTLVETIFHELAHERLHIAGDTEFNEAYATLVGEEGVRRWLAARGEDATLAAWLRDRERGERVLRLIREARLELARLYASDASAAEKRAAKAEIIATLRSQYEMLKTELDGYDAYDRWFAGRLNNAHFVAVAIYWERLPAFRALLGRCQGDMAAFHAAVERLAAWPPEARAATLSALAGNVRADLGDGLCPPGSARPAQVPDVTASLLLLPPSSFPPAVQYRRP